MLQPNCASTYEFLHGKRKGPADIFFSPVVYWHSPSVKLKVNKSLLTMTAKSKKDKPLKEREESGTIRGLDFHAVAIIDTRFSMFMPGNHRQKVSRRSSFRTSTRVCTVADPPHLPFLRKTFADQ
jgi:hypothetical protein